MSTPLYDGLLSEVLAGAHVHRDRLATARAGVDRLHGPDALDHCTTCGTAWPCATRRLVDGLARGDLDDSAAGALVEAEVATASSAVLDPADPSDPVAEVAAPAQPAPPAAPESPVVAYPTAAAPVAATAPVDPEAPVRPLPRMPMFAELLEVGRTSRALDVLLGRRPHS